MAYATSAEFLARVDDAFIDQLAAPDGGAPDETRVTAALDDASAELDGWLGRISSERHPGAATLRVHAVKVALYLLTLNRPVADLEPIRQAYEDTIEFYRALTGDADPSGIGGSSEAPEAVFDDDSLEGLV